MVCLLHSHRRTFLLLEIVTFSAVHIWSFYIYVIVKQLAGIFSMKIMSWVPIRAQVEIILLKRWSAYSLTIKKNPSGLGPTKFTLVGLTIMLIVGLIAIATGLLKHCSQMFIEVVVNWPWCDLGQNCHQIEPASHWGKAKRIGLRRTTDAWVATVAFLGIACSFLSVDRCSVFRIMGELQPCGKGIYIWNICLKCCVYAVWICICLCAKD